MATADEDLNQVLDRIEALAEPGKATIEGGFDARAVIAALLIRCRENLRAVRLLGAAGLKRVVDPLVRATLEYAATSGWLMTKPEEHFRLLQDAGRRDLRLALETYQTSFGPIEMADTKALSFLNSGREASLPSIEERAKSAGLGHWYGLYRVLSTRSHATLLGAFSGASVLHEGQMVDTTAYRSSLLAVAAFTLRVAELANGIFSWGREADLREADARLVTLIQASRRELPQVLSRPEM